MRFCRLMIFPGFFFQLESFGNIIKMPNISDPDQTRHFIEPDLAMDLNCLQMLSADDISRLRVN